MVAHWIWLATRKGLSLQDKRILLEQYGDAARIYESADYCGLSQEGQAALADKDMTSVRKILADCESGNIHILTWQDAGYPRQLRYIEDAPLVLYYIGTWPDVESVPCIAAVGTRKASAYGVSCAARIGAQLAMCGAIVVSGMALGIDSAAMTGALSASGRVIGVLGGGVDIIYPAANKALYHRVQKNGCLISEYPPGSQPQKWTFPRRNRIISGLSQGVLVVEAPRASGALNTANHALEQGRDVYAVPGNVSSLSSAGCNELLRNGAGLAATGWDILEGYQSRFPETITKAPGCDDPTMVLQRQPTDPENPENTAQESLPEENRRKENPEKHRKAIDNSPLQPYSDVNKPILKLTPQAESILAQLTQGDMHVDELIYRSGINAAQAISTLTMLEIKGIIRRLPGKIIHRVET